MNDLLANHQAYLDKYVIPWGIKILLALLILLIGLFLVKLIISLSRKLMHNARLDDILINFVNSILNAVLVLFVLVAALDQLGVNTTSMVALIGAAGIAIGLALQDSLKNFSAGVMLVIFRPFKNGDFIDAGGIMGVVEQIGIFSTTMRTPDNREVIVPNGAIYGSTITNFSARDTRRLDLVFGIAYGDDLRRAKEIIGQVLAAEPRVLAEPAPLVAVGELGESSVNLVVRPWVGNGDYWDVKFALTEAVKLAFDAQGISIPFPQMDVHLDKGE